jgi:NAD(P)-dependent dehydrogenase (short-subunit alcohol dehydrogenase family)
MDSERFAGREVVVFGATGALGGGVAEAFVAAGARVTGVDRQVPQADRARPGISYAAADALDDAALGAFFDRLAASGGPWAVVNTIGGYAGRRPLAELDQAELVTQLQLNLVTAALITKHALRVLRRAGAGRIVHTASRAAVVTAGNSFAYSVSKAGVLHLVAMAADEVRGSGITVTCVVPSIIDTPANRAALPGSDHDAWPQVPDIARTYLFLADPLSGLVNGSTVPV